MVREAVTERIAREPSLDEPAWDETAWNESDWIGAMTTDELREHASSWERHERSVLETLHDLRLSADSALKAVNELKTDFSVYKAESSAKLQSQNEEISELKTRLDKANSWLMGILAAMLVFLIQQLFTMLSHAPAVMK